MDSDELIPEIDSLYPEYWYGIDAEKFPYYRALQELLIGTGEMISLSEIGMAEASYSPIADESFVQLQFRRMTIERKKAGGAIEETPKIEEIPVQAVLRKTERLVLITGDAGAGKSTSLRRLAYIISRKGLEVDAAYDIPVLARCNELEKAPSLRLVDLIAEITCRITKKPSACFNAADLHHGRVIVMLDALDEVSDEKQRSKVLQKVKDFHADYPKCFVIITSRKHGFDMNSEELAPFIGYELSPFSIEQAERLVDGIYSLVRRPGSETSEILRRIKDVHGMDLSPMLVTILVATSDYNRQDMPANVTELFKKYTEMMLGRWDKQKGLSQQIHAPIKDHLLKSLASKIHQNGKTSLPLSDCREHFKQELTSIGQTADLDVLIQEIIYRSGLLRIVGTDVEFRLPVRRTPSCTPW